MNRISRPLLLALGLAAAGCASSDHIAGDGDRPAEHIVARGETLSAIAFRYGLDPAELARLNNIGNPDRILVGQRLVLGPDGGSGWTPGEGRAPAAAPRKSAGSTALARRVAGPSTAPARASEADNAALARAGSWHWPARGVVSKGFDAEVPGRKGIQIDAGLGQPVSAALGGEVVYQGSGLPGYGRLIIVKHSESLLSAYGYLGRILVGEGDRVSAGQAIGEVGTSPENRPGLHFEIRQNGRAVDPLRFLPG